MAKNKGGREVRKPKQAKPAKNAEPTGVLKQATPAKKK